ncbi:ricin B lectin domain-containing protein [Sporodiniella umbellata]|nr:ricin B lectin domain-containing protein [Sporodiniella umbellata]
MEAVTDFPQGFFFIRCKAKAFSLDVNGGGMTNDTHLIIWPQKMVDSINQLWMHEDGFLINKKSGLVLDIRGGIERDRVIIQYARKPGLAHNQRWKYEDGYIFIAANPSLVLDIKGGEYKNGSTVFLNARNPHSQTQQFLIQPFENEKSKEELALLRPPPNQRNSPFPRREELYECYRLVYLDNKQVSPYELAGASAFKAMKDYVSEIKQANEAVVANDDSRKAVSFLVEQETKQLLTQHQLYNQDLVTEAIKAADSYFSNEYS